jgi:hypothetical protein
MGRIFLVMMSRDHGVLGFVILTVPLEIYKLAMFPTFRNFVAIHPLFGGFFSPYVGQQLFFYHSLMHKT